MRRTSVAAIAALSLLENVVDARPALSDPFARGPGGLGLKRESYAGAPGYPDYMVASPLSTSRSSSVSSTSSVASSSSTLSTSTTATTSSAKSTSSSTSTKNTTTTSSSSSSTKKTTTTTSSSKTSSTSSKTTSTSSKASSTTTSSSSSSSTAASSTTVSASSTNTTTGVLAYATATNVIRGANIGGWLILEEWMNSDVFAGTGATDQYTFDQTSGAAAKLQSHWSSYFQESDVATMAGWGINALRIPIGFWAYDTLNTSYIQGADAYLEQAIGWARNYGMKVLIDCHGSPGSQNGYDNSGHAGSVQWQNGTNLNDSIAVLVKMATKYGTNAYADVVLGLELVNEPLSWAPNSFVTNKEWAYEAFYNVTAAVENPDFKVIMHDSFQGPAAWTDIGGYINGKDSKATAPFVIDSHLYQNQVASDSLLTQAQHISKACNWTSTYLLPQSSTMPVYVGEWSSSSNVCVNPDGTTTAGTSCSVTGCQCSATTPIANWNQPLIDATRMYVEAQMDAFEHSSQGWFVWAYKGPGGWGLNNMVEYGLIGSDVTERKYPNQCGFTS